MNLADPEGEFRITAAGGCQRAGDKQKCKLYQLELGDVLLPQKGLLQFQLVGC